MTDHDHDHDTDARRDRPAPKAIAYFEGAAFWDAFDAQRVEYAGPEARLFLLKAGDKYYVAIKGPDGDGGEPLNDSHLCPGSPACF